MPTYEQNFDSAEYQLILSTAQSSTTIDNWGLPNDYIRMSVFNSNSNIYIGSFYSGSSEIIQQSQFITYTDSDNNMFVAPNDALNNAFNLIGQRVPDGNYKIKYDFLNNPFNYTINFIIQFVLLYNFILLHNLFYYKFYFFYLIWGIIFCSCLKDWCKAPTSNGG